ncbi:hypothetical protein Tco_1091740 [Tanacetum coccineum]|uniref:Reverse transcriptase domain-containing protein n=1 Tax=Tanacetum coccineum TaxID=301880 RepID=A0ABQ5I9T0_9ASTR
MQPTSRGHLKRACHQISYLETPTREVGLKTPYLICDYYGGSHKADECKKLSQAEHVCLSEGDIYNDPSLLRFYQNNDTSPWRNNKRKEKGEDGPEWIVKNKFEDEIANFMLEKKSHAKGIGNMLVQHRKELLNHDGKWTEEDEEEDSNKALAVSFYLRTEPVEPLEWKASDNQLKPSSIEPPKLELKELPEHLEYTFLQEDNQLPVVISSALSIDKKTRLLKVILKKGGMTVVKNEKDELIPQQTVTGWRVSTFQRCMTAIFHELIEDNMEVFMKDFSVFGSFFDHYFKNLEKMLKRYEETNLVLNWEKCHFMVKEVIVLGHKVSGSRIEVDKAKIEAISKLPYPTNVKAV